jgi:MerR family transcriptional regulator/heat shock protein HspR
LNGETIGMARKYLRISEVVKICGVDESFVTRLEREHLIRAMTNQNRKLYSLDQVDRIRVARLLIKEMGVNLEGAEVVLHMREQMLTLQRQLRELVRRSSENYNSGQTRS